MKKRSYVIYSNGKSRVILRDGFSFFSAMIPVVSAMFSRAWITFLLIVLINMVFNFQISMAISGLSDPSVIIRSLSLLKTISDIMFFGFFGYFLMSWDLGYRGWARFDGYDPMVTRTLLREKNRMKPRSKANASVIKA